MIEDSLQQAAGNLPPLRNSTSVSATVSATLHFVSLRVTSCLLIKIRSLTPQQVAGLALAISVQMTFLKTVYAGFR